MKTIIVDGVAYTLPLHIYRVPGAWQVRAPGHKSKSFPERVCGGVTEALKAATEHRHQLMPPSELDAVVCRKFGGTQVLENFSKFVPTGEPGIFQTKGGASLLIRTKGLPARVIPSAYGMDAARLIRQQQCELKAQMRKTNKRVSS